jgi:hypothetical protein
MQADDAGWRGFVNSLDHIASSYVAADRDLIRVEVYTPASNDLCRVRRIALCLFPFRHAASNNRRRNATASLHPTVAKQKGVNGCTADSLTR